MNSNTSFWQIIPLWLSCIGTVSAVIVALYLSRRDRSIRCSANVNISTLVEQNSTNTEDYLSITVTNIGYRAFVFTGIGWRKGIFKKKYLWQLPPTNQYSTRGTVKLSDGDEAKYLIPLKDFENNIYPALRVQEKYFKRFLSRFTKIVVYTSIENITLNLNKQFRKILVDYDSKR
jgi:hypothetical protein